MQDRESSRSAKMGTWSPASLCRCPGCPIRHLGRNHQLTGMASTFLPAQLRADGPRPSAAVQVSVLLTPQNKVLRRTEAWRAVVSGKGGVRVIISGHQRNVFKKDVEVSRDTGERKMRLELLSAPELNAAAPGDLGSSRLPQQPPSPPPLCLCLSSSLPARLPPTFPPLPTHPSLPTSCHRASPLRPAPTLAPSLTTQSPKEQV